MKDNSLPKTFWWLNATQFGGAMNDNVFKLLMVYALIAWKGDSESASILASVGLVFAIPFLLIVPIAGNFADRYSKRELIVKLKGTEFLVMSFGATALFMQSGLMLYITMFLMSAQSAFFGPSKYGLIPEQVPTEKLSKANGSIQLFTFLAIISGTVLAPELSLLVNGKFGLASTVCLIISAGGFLAAINIEPSPAHPNRKLSLSGFGTVFKTLADVRQRRFPHTFNTRAICFLSRRGVRSAQRHRLWRTASRDETRGSDAFIPADRNRHRCRLNHSRLAQWQIDRMGHRSHRLDADEPFALCSGNDRARQRPVLRHQHVHSRIRRGAFHCPA